MAKKKSSSSKKKQSFPKDIVYIIVIAVLVVALLVSLFKGEELKAILGLDGAFTPSTPEEPTPDNPKIYTSVLSGVGNVTLPTEFDGNSCLEVHFVDVGQGDAIVVMFPDGKTMLIDSGSGTSVNAAVRDSYMTYLSDNLNLDKVEYMLVTHPDADHVNIIGNVLEQYDVDNIYYNEYSHHESLTKVYENFLADAEGEPEVTVYGVGGESATYQITGEGYVLDIYAPGYNAFYEEAYESNNRNILSIMCVLTYGGRKMMFTGDAEVPTEEWFMDTVGGTLLDVDILKVGHHGSESCTSTAFLDFIRPEYAVISSDDGQAYGHPHADTMNKLFDYGVVTYRTNRHGNIVLYVADDGDFGFLPENDVPVENNTKNLNPNTIKLAD